MTAENKSFLSGTIAPMIITLMFLIAVPAAYIASGNARAYPMESEESEKNSLEPTTAGEATTEEAPETRIETNTPKADPPLYENLYENIRFKAAYTNERQIKIFAQAKNNALAKYAASEGNPIPETDAIVIGSNEAETLRKEGSFKQTGDKIRNAAGLEFLIGGILTQTSSPADYLYFVSGNGFDSVQGDEYRIFVRTDAQKRPKMFFIAYEGEEFPMAFQLAEGDIRGYTTHEIMGRKYFPMIIGSKEAEIMRKEKLFENTGDIIQGFFGMNAVVTGIIEETGSGLDMMHITPVNMNNLNN